MQEVIEKRDNVVKCVINVINFVKQQLQPFVQDLTTLLTNCTNTTMAFRVYFICYMVSVDDRLDQIDPTSIEELYSGMKFSKNLNDVDRIYYLSKVGNEATL